MRPVERCQVADVTGDAVADGTASGDGIGRRQIDERRFLQEGHFQVELLRTVLRWHMVVAGPDDVADLQAVAVLPRLPHADLIVQIEPIV